MNDSIPTRSKLLHSLAVATLIGTGYALTGCEAPPEGQARGKNIFTMSEGSLESPRLIDPRIDARVDDRATQAQRDVDAYLKHKQESASPGRTKWTGEQTSNQPPVESGREQVSRKVIFNDGPNRRTTQRRPSQPQAKSTADEESFNQSPLFRDPVEVPEVMDLSNASRSSGVNLRPNRMSQLLVDLRRELYIEGAHSDQPLKQLLPIAALAMVDPDSPINPEAVPDLTATERELLGALQEFFQNLGEKLNGDADAEEVIAQSITQLREAVIKEPVLKLPTLELCYKVEGFGKFSKFNSFRFLAHTEQQVIVYVEIDDFTSEQNEKGEWVTQLAQQVTIYSDRDGIPVWRSGDMQTAVDISQNQRHDFFLLQIITLPKALSVGKYQMKVRVRDEKSGAEAEDAVEFEMVADPKLAVKIP